MTAAALRHARYVVTENPITLVAFSMLLILLLLALLGPALAPYDPLKSDTASTLKPPSARHWFGTDQLGRDMLSRVVVATRLDAMGIVAALGNSVFNVILATAIINLPFYARMARAEANVRREAGFVEAARLSGNGTMRVLAVHIYPNCLPPMMVQASLNLGWAMLNAAGLAFIGLGVRPPTPEWGILVAEGASFILSGEWWIALFPGLALMLAVFCFNLMGDGLRDLIDPRRRT